MVREKMGEQEKTENAVRSAYHSNSKNSNNDPSLLLMTAKVRYRDVGTCHAESMYPIGDYHCELSVTRKMTAVDSSSS